MELSKPKGVSVCLIAAVDKNGAIGAGNALPWHHPLEMKYFRQMTINGTVLMGANTWRSLGCKPLVQRRNIVLTSDPEQFGEPPLDTHFITDPNEAFKLLKSDELLVIGGAKVYELFLPVADWLFITEIDVVVEAPDAFFPKFDETDYHPVQRYPRERAVHGDVTLPAWTVTTRARRVEHID